jgi:DNA-binding response OmpR family regulator
MKVLVIDDDAYIAEAYSDKMTALGYEFKVATDGEAGLKVLQEWVPDAVILDLVMPRKDGFATLEAIKQDSNLAHIPVLVASNLGQQEDIDRVMKLGAKDFIIKSNATPDDIVNRLHDITGRRH